ncbi:MAG: FkbM family methyltransferase [Chthoniobacterales bacterium]|nr:FkbM family methyltransferase [Chthoniobacterales bacterium]
MNSFVKLGRRLHVLHALRKQPLFRAITRTFDPIIPRRLPSFPQPISLRLLSHASLIADGEAQESSVRETFTAILKALPERPAEVFWDVGANVGFFGWYCATLRPDFMLVSFEPDTKNLRCLERTSRRWKLPNHVIIPCAVSEKSGRMIFHADELSGATGTLAQSGQDFNLRHYGCVSPQVEVNTTSLDDCLRHGIPAPSILKIDVEGAELRVLEGAAETIGRHRPILFFETFAYGREIVTYLEASQYICFDSDRRQSVTAETINFVAVAPNDHAVALPVLANLGYPIPLAHES